MKSLFLALILCLFSAPAWSQNPTCPTRLPGDSTNACASTAFVNAPVTGALAGLPGLTTNVASTNISGLQLPCTSAFDCGWIIFQVPTTVAEDDVNALRVQRIGNYTGGTGGTINATLWTLVSSAPHGANSEWAIVGQFYNETQAAFSGTGTGSMAVNATSQKINPAGVGGGPQPTTITISNGTPSVITWPNHGLVAGDHFQLFTTGALPASLAVKTWYYVLSTNISTNTFEFALTAGGTPINTTTAGSGVQSAVYEVGSTWAFNSNCIYQKDIINPLNSCSGAEIDINGFVGNGTDVNKQRVGLQIACGVEDGVDTGVHCGMGLNLNAQQGAQYDTAIQVQDSSPAVRWNVTGAGAQTIQSPTGSWSSSNYGPSLVIAGAGTTNPTIGFFDVSNANGWSIGVNGGQLLFSAMPAVSDSVSAAVTAAAISRTGVFTPAYGVALPVYTVAQLNALTGMVKGQVVYVYDTVITSPVWHGQVTGGSNVTVGGMASYDGTHWNWD